MGVLGKLKYAATAVGGAALGYAGALYSEVTAKANFAVRPELANVDWVTAALAGHATDWFFYFYPKECTLASVAVGAVAVTAMAYIYTRD